MQLAGRQPLLCAPLLLSCIVNVLPFGGVGESGHGRQILRYTFEEFSYLRSCIDVPIRYVCLSLCNARTSELWITHTHLTFPPALMNRLVDQ